jgi:hypothetical protein
LNVLKQIFVNSFPATEDEYTENEIFSTLHRLFSKKALDFRFESKMNWKTKLNKITQSYMFYLISIVLIFIDTLCVLIQVIKFDTGFTMSNVFLHMQKTAEITSLAIITIFLALFALKTLVRSDTFFHRKFEILDALLLLVSLGLEIGFMANKNSNRGFEISLVIFR